MVHVLTNVLHKVHRALKTEGFVLVVQPASKVDFLLELEIEGRIEYAQPFKEPNFQKHLKATETSIRTVLAEGLFVKENEVTIPGERFYHRDDYESVDDWEESRISDCVDLDALREVSTNLRSLVNGREHRLYEYWKEYQALLRKSQI